jgi:hypothetical protein
VEEVRTGHGGRLGGDAPPAQEKNHNEESAALLGAFGKTLIPILTKAGVTPVDPKVYPVTG